MAEPLEEDDDIRQEVLDIVREILELDEEEMTDELLATQRLSDLDADTEARTQIAERIETDLDVDLPDSFMNRRDLTVNELVGQVIALHDEE